LRASSGGNDIEIPMDGDTAAMLKELDSVELDIQEQSMSPAELLVHRFAAAEANDLRLSSVQRLKKTSKMMSDLESDISGLMGQWLPKRHNQQRQHSKALVFSVRQLIGHFNVLVGQMKEAEVGQQKATEDLKKKDLRIRQLEEENLVVFKLRNELKAKDRTIEQLKRDCDYFKSQVDDEEMAEQAEEAVNQQVLYLDHIMRTRRSTNNLSGDVMLSLVTSHSEASSVTSGSMDVFAPPDLLCPNSNDWGHNVHSLTPLTSMEAESSLDDEDDDGPITSSFTFPNTSSNKK